MTAAVAALTPVAPPQSYADQGWKTLFDVRGDLNRDGRDDRTMIVEAPEKMTEPPAGCARDDDYSDAPVRRPLVILADADGAITLAVDEPQTVLRSDQGGIMGDPLVEFRIERGAIVIDYYGGSRQR